MSVTGGRMRIGEVHALLRQDYPDIELSKIRYYEDKGLVEPSRSRKGYRLYSDRDVACLREAIRLAQEEFVPLRVVRLRLVEQGLLSDGPSAAPRHVAREAGTATVTATAPVATVRPELKVVPAPAQRADPPSRASYLAPDALRELELDVTVVNQLVALGFVSASSLAGESAFSDADVRIAQFAGALLARGVDARVLGALRRVVEREVGVIEDLTAPLRVPSRRLSREQAKREVAAVAAEVESLRALLLERALSSYLGH
jgi:DNA-binding transcriptional MerR regulator